MATKYVLAIDGGGIRGILPLCVLANLEQQLKKPAREIFSFLAGTSTGAFIVAALATGVPAEKILQIYSRRAPEIFKSSFPNLIKRIFWGYMYENQKLAEILVQELPELATWKFNDSPVDLLITAKRVKDAKPFYFVKDHAQNSCECGNLRLLDCVLASAAAPTYFAPWEIKGLGKFVDGAVGVAGNPVYQVCVEAFYYHDEYEPKQTSVLSLGTGHFVDLTEPHNLWSWFKWLLRELLASPGEQQSELVQRHFDLKHFYRLDPQLERSIALDDVEQIPELSKIGRKFATSVDWSKIFNYS